MKAWPQSEAELGLWGDAFTWGPTLGRAYQSDGVRSSQPETLYLQQGARGPRVLGDRFQRVCELQGHLSSVVFTCELANPAHPSLGTTAHFFLPANPCYASERGGVSHRERKTSSLFSRQTCPPNPTLGQGRRHLIIEQN